MKSQSVKQFAIVRSDSASAFEEQLNAKMRELYDVDPEVVINDSGDHLTAQISYRVPLEFEHREKCPSETGIRFVCQECPCFQPVLKADGTEDGRARYGNCKFAEYGRTYRDSKACPVLYKMIQNGGVRLCFSE